MKAKQQRRFAINKLAVASIVLVVLVGVIALGLRNRSQTASDYKPVINPSEFSTNITNRYFSLPAGKTMVYEGQTKAGLEKIEISIIGESKTIMGVKTLLYQDKVYLNGQLHEDTKDYLAQDKDGNVWYFGEEVNNYEDGKLIDHKGSFIAGEDGALPGIWIKADHKVGDFYRQEFYEGEAEDMARVIAVDQTVTTKLATYVGCVKIYETNPLNPDSKENKYYCPDAGTVVLIEDVTDGGKIELTSLTGK